MRNMDKSTTIGFNNFEQNKSIIDENNNNNNNSKNSKFQNSKKTNAKQHNNINKINDKNQLNTNFLLINDKQEKTNDFMKSSLNSISKNSLNKIPKSNNENMNSQVKRKESDDEDDDELLLVDRRRVTKNDNDSNVLRKKLNNIDFNNRTSDQEYSEIANNDEDEDTDDDEYDPNRIVFTGYVEISLKYFNQTSKPRYWCLKMITSPWFERISMLVIIVNCITLGMYQPCNDNPCLSTRCRLLTYLDHFIFVFFAIEMSIKILAMGFWGQDTYMADSWNRLDFFIVLAGTFEYAIASENLSLSAIRTVRVLRPLRAINRVPSMRILVMLLLDTLPMLGNVLLLCFFVFFIFGIVGVQLWKGVLRNRCFFDYNRTLMGDFLDESFESTYYKPEHVDSFICSEGNAGMTTCADIPPFVNNSRICNSTIEIIRAPHTVNSSRACINWNYYYSKCRPSDKNPFKGAISFDNIGYAWVAIFQIISLESWVTIMYFIQDAHSFWNWVYFVFLIVIGSFFMINLCLVVIATQFSETKKRETERMIAERRRFSRSSSTLLSDSGGEPGSCWEEFLKYAGHLIRKSKRRIVRIYNQYKSNKNKNSSDKTLKLNKKSGTNKDESIRLILNNSENVISNNTINLSCKCKCHMINYVKSNNENLITESGLDTNQSKDIPTINEIGSIENFDANLSSKNADDIKLDSISDMIPNNRVTSQKINDSELCSVCKHVKKVDINHKKVINLNDSAILSFSIASTNSKILNRNMNRINNNNDLNVYKEDSTDAPVGNQEYFYCYSTNVNTTDNMCDTTSNYEDLPYSKENNDSDDVGETKTNSPSYRRTKNRLRKVKQAKTPNCFLDCCCFCCSERMAKTRLCFLINLLNKKLKDFVDGKLFQRTILFAILINTFCMGIEHHEQPHTLTLIVEYSNFFFTFVFLIEMILKIFAYGVYEYIKNAFNLFDGVIVGISCYEVFKQLNPSHANGQVVASGVSVLRTFRLLRILKLVRFMPALRRQLIVMLRTIDNVATFFSLLVLFIFIFSILGMNLFGCKFCAKQPDGSRVCERKNFDSLLWATITVFQVLTQEDWNEVLYNGMEKTSSWAALYFIALMTFGNYVLFNLLVAILVEGFSTEDEPKKAIEDRIIEEAMQAIAEEHSKESAPGGNLSRRNSRRKSRKNSKVSEDVNFVPELEPVIQPLPEISINDTSEDAKLLDNSSSKRDGLNLNFVYKNKRLIHPPIITHTCPTPTYTPSNSSRNSPLPRKHIFHLNHEKFKFTRKFSLDSSDHRLNKIYNNIRAQSTTTKIFDKKDFLLKTARSDISNLNSILKNGDSKKKMCPRKIDFRLWNDSFKDRSKSNETLKYSSDKDSIITNDSKLDDEDKKQYDFHMRKRLSKSFHEKLIISSSSLTIPKPVQKRSRSKSEKIKTKNNKIFDQQEINKKEENLESNENNKLEDSSIVIGINNHKPVIIKKSEPFNIDITLSNNLANEKIETETKILPNNVKLDFGAFKSFSKPTGCLKNREQYSLYIFSVDNKFRKLCTTGIEKKWFDYTILFFIALNCITLAMERPNIPQNSLERKFLTNSNYAFTYIFALEMLIKVVSKGLYVGKNAYLKSGWNKMDGLLVIISLIDAIVTLTARSSPKIFGILRVFRLLRTLRPLRVISRAPGLKLVVQTLLSSLRPIGNIVLICCTFFIIFGILGVQLFKGKLYRCSGVDIQDVKTREDCLKNPNNQWINSQYNFDNLGQALMALFVLSSKDGWVQIMYTGIDAVGVDKQPIENYNEWMLLYFISFLLLVGFFVLNMFVGVIIENFHKCRAEQEREEKARRAAKRARKFEIKRKKMKEIPYYANYSKMRRILHDVCNSKYFDLVIAGVIGLNVVSMSLEFYMMPEYLDEALDWLNLVFTFIFLVEAIMRLVAIGFYRYFKERWNQLDILIVVLSIIGIIFDKISTKSAIPINPTIIRVMRVLRIARVLKLLKMASGIRSLLDTVIQALPQVGNLGLLFFLLFFIFAILGVELFGKLNCEDTRSACDGLSKHAHFHNFGMAFLTLFRIATGDNWNGIMKDTLKDNILCQDEPGKTNTSMCLASILAPIYFVIFVLMAQFVLVNVVVAVLMKHLDDSNKMMADDAEMDEEIEKQLENEARNNIYNERTIKMEDELEDQNYRRLTKQNSLPPNFIFDLKSVKSDTQLEHSSSMKIEQDENENEITPVHKSSKKIDIIEEDNEKCTPIDDEIDSAKHIFKKDNLINARLFKLTDDESSWTSMAEQSDSASEIIRSRRYRKMNKFIDDEVKSHFSPKSSIRIRVIDETDTDNNDNY